MVGLLLRINVHEAAMEEFTQFLQRQAFVARHEEPDCINFDAYSSTDEAGVIFLYESYESDAALEFHKSLAPYRELKQNRERWLKSVVVLVRTSFPIIASK